MLNQQGRRKAQFLVNAVMHYVHCSETPNIPEPAMPNIDTIEQVVRRILEEQDKKNDISENSIQKEARRSIKSEEINLDDTKEILGDEGVATIARTMMNFRV